MQEYKTTDTVRLPGGRIGLTKAQAAKRARHLKKVSDGKYDVLTPVVFKAGEVIQMDGAIDKSIRHKLEKKSVPKKRHGSGS